MQCPKCKKEQESEKECGFCGVIFEKYLEAAADADKKRSSTDSESPKSSLLLPALVIVVLAACAAGSFYYFKMRPRGAGDAAVVSSSTSSTVAVVDRTDSLSRKIEVAFPPKNRIEAARNATVLIETSWGALGSGFFIDDRCHIVTNRHVVKIEDADIKKASDASDAYKASIDREKASLEEARKHPRFAYDGNMQRQVQEREQQLETMIDQLNRVNVILYKARYAEPSDIKVTVIDGTELAVQSVEVSDKQDLALLLVAGNDSPYIVTANTKTLAQGQQLFTVGTPQGLKFSVTSGIFSGWQEIQGTQVLQTDSPINPGNSGGPLLDNTGKVVGVNTAVLSGAQNIGFALPIDAVFREFPIQLSDHTPARP